MRRRIGSLGRGKKDEFLYGKVVLLEIAIDNY